MGENGWIGVDLDGTLAEYDHWRGEDHIGAPVPAMVDRVKAWLADGRDVRIFTARASTLHSGADGVPGQDRVYSTTKAVMAIDRWCRIVFGRTLPITCEKDYLMVELWDDRAVQVVPNTGERAVHAAHAAGYNAANAVANVVRADADGVFRFSTLAGVCTRGAHPAGTPCNGYPSPTCPIAVGTTGIVGTAG
jgi:hypothetical protein